MTENKNNSDYAIYCYDFHVGERSVINNDKDGNKFLPKAQKCFAKLFDLNTVEKRRTCKTLCLSPDCKQMATAK